MRVDDLQAELRARTPWEAIDLGFAMSRRWWQPLWAAWICLVVPLQLGIFALLARHPLLAVALVWWLLPLWERVALFVLSRCLFGVRPTVRRTASELRATVLSGLLGDLTLRRLSPARTVILPVSQLERLSGGRASARRRLLSERVQSTGSGLALACAMAEAGLLCGVAVLATWVLPDTPAWGAEVLLSRLTDGGWWSTMVLGAVVVAVTAAVQPVRTGAAFGLYLQRRTVLEGWDVELTFRRLAERLARRSVGVATALLVLALALGTGAATAQNPAEEARVRDATAQVLLGDDFGGTRTETRWRLREDLPQTDTSPRERSATLPRTPLAGGLQIVLGLLVGVALVGLLISVLSRAPPLPERTAAAAALVARARTGMLALDGSALPEHPAQAAWALWEQGRQEDALGLLYRAAVAHLVSQRKLEVDDSATEGDCLRVARRTLPARPATYLGHLTRAWQQLAYAHRPVDDQRMRQLVDDWGELDAGAT